MRINRRVCGNQRSVKNGRYHVGRPSMRGGSLAIRAWVGRRNGIPRRCRRRRIRWQPEISKKLDSSPLESACCLLFDVVVKCGAAWNNRIGTDPVTSVAELTICRKPVDIRYGCGKVRCRGYVDHAGRQVRSARLREQPQAGNSRNGHGDLFAGSSRGWCRLWDGRCRSFDLCRTERTWGIRRNAKRRCGRRVVIASSGSWRSGRNRLSRSPEGSSRCPALPVAPALVVDHTPVCDSRGWVALVPPACSPAPLASAPGSPFLWGPESIGPPAGLAGAAKLPLSEKQMGVRRCLHLGVDRSRHGQTMLRQNRGCRGNVPSGPVMERWRQQRRRPFRRRPLVSGRTTDGRPGDEPTDIRRRTHDRQER